MKSILNGKLKAISLAALVTVSLALSAPAKATVFFETEANNTLATANDVSIHDGTISVFGVTDSAVPLFNNFRDYFRFTAQAGNTLTITTDPTSLLPTYVPFVVDTVIAIFNSSGTLLFSNDDSGIDFLSFMTQTIASTGTYYVGVSDGGNNFTTNYNLTITGLTPTASAGVPEPASLFLFGLGGALLLARWRTGSLARPVI